MYSRPNPKTLICCGRPRRWCWRLPVVLSAKSEDSNFLWATSSFVLAVQPPTPTTSSIPKNNKQLTHKEKAKPHTQTQQTTDTTKTKHAKQRAQTKKSSTQRPTNKIERRTHKPTTNKLERSGHRKKTPRVCVTVREAEWMLWLNTADAHRKKIFCGGWNVKWKTEASLGLAPCLLVLTTWPAIA